MLTINLLRKSCIRCRRERPATAFYAHPNMHLGLQSKCKPCSAKAVEEWRRGNRTAANKYRADYTRNLKARVFAKFGNVCGACGFADIRALQLDHVHNDGAIERFPNGRSQHAVSRVGVLQRALKDTAGRYQVLCANCHAVKTWESNEIRRIATMEIH